MISRDKLISLLSNSKFKKIDLPNNIKYTQLSFFDTKKKEYDDIISNFKILNTKSNVLDVVSNNKEDLSNYYDNVLNSTDDINNTSNNYKNKINYDTYLNYSENDKVILPEILSTIFNDNSINDTYKDDKIFLYGVKNPESYYKTILLLTNIEFIVKNKYESNQALLTFKKKIAYALQSYYDDNNFKLFPEKYFNPQKAVKNILNKENYVDIGIHQYICMHLKKNILIFNLQEKTFQYFSYKLNNQIEIVNNDCYLLINNNGVYLPCMNTNKKHLFNKEIINYIKNKYSWENYDMYLKFDESKLVIDARHNNNNLNNNQNSNENIDKINLNKNDTKNKVSINKFNTTSINNNNKINFNVNNKNDSKDKNNNITMVNIDDIQKDFQPKIKKTNTKTKSSKEKDNTKNTKNTNETNKESDKNDNKVFILDDIKSYKLPELQKLAESKKLPIIKKGKTKDIKKTKQELYNELKGLFK